MRFSEPNSANSGAALFPLATTPFEQYMLADDRGDYPMTFPVRIDYTGTIEQEILKKARDEALLRHPLLNALIQRKSGQIEWIPFQGEHESIDSGPEENPLLPGVPIDLTKHPGVRIAVRQEEGYGSIHFLFHHAACDGIGGLRFAGDVLSAYGQLFGNPESSPRFLPLVPSNLLHRGTPQLKTPPLPSRSTIFATAIRESLTICRHRPAHLAGGICADGAAERKPDRRRLQFITVPREDYANFCSRASRLGVTVNDLLLRDLFLVTNRWMEKTTSSSRKSWIRIAMPTALFGSSGATMPAANCLGFTFLTRPGRITTDEQNQLLEDIAAETALIRRWQLGSVFVDVLRRAAKIPGLLLAGTRLSTRFSTLVLSNLGNPSRRFRSRFPTGKDAKLVSGNLFVERVIGAPPIRPGTRAALALFVYRGNLDIALNADPRWFSPADGEAFLSLYLDQIKQTSEESF